MNNSLMLLPGADKDVSLIQAPSEMSPFEPANGSNEEEADLTNLTWLTELRNQSLSWSNAFNIATEDDDKAGSGLNADHFEASKTVTALEGKTFSGTGIKGKNSKGQKQGPISNSSSSCQRQQQQQELTFKRPTPSERYKTFVEKIRRDLLQYEQSAANYQTDTSEKPPFNYSHIIGMAMLENGRVTLQQICAWIEAKFAFFRVRKKWNNSIRHNLSLHHCFRKIDRNKYEKGKGGYWELGVDPKKCDRKRIRNRKSKKNSNATSKQQQPQKLSWDKEAKEQVEQTETRTTNETEQEVPNVTTCATFDFDQLAQDAPYIASETLPQIPQSSEGQQQYHLGTIIISTTAAKSNGTVGELEALENCDFETLRQLNIAYHEVKDAIPGAEDFTISSSCLTNSSPTSAAVNIETEMLSLPPCSSPYLPIQNGTPTKMRRLPADFIVAADQQQPNVIVEHVYPPITLTTEAVSESGNLEGVATGYCYCIEPSSAASSTMEGSANFSNVLGGISDSFRPYIDGIEEAFQYLRSIDQNNRNEDLFDHILDISVSDY